MPGIAPYILYHDKLKSLELVEQEREKVMHYVNDTEKKSLTLSSNRETSHIMKTSYISTEIIADLNLSVEKRCRELPLTREKSRIVSYFVAESVPIDQGERAYSELYFFKNPEERDSFCEPGKNMKKGSENLQRLEINRVKLKLSAYPKEQATIAFDLASLLKWFC